MHGVPSRVFSLLTLETCFRLKFILPKLGVLTLFPTPYHIGKRVGERARGGIFEIASFFPEFSASRVRARIFAAQSGKVCMAEISEFGRVFAVHSFFLRASWFDFFPLAHSQNERTGGAFPIWISYCPILSREICLHAHDLFSIDCPTLACGIEATEIISSLSGVHVKVEANLIWNGQWFSGYLLNFSLLLLLDFFSAEHFEFRERRSHHRTLLI